MLERLGLAPRRYFLYVSRFEPENNPHRVAAAYRQVGGDLPLVMVGGAPYAGKFIDGFTRGADSRILFPGAIYGEGYRELLSHALAYVHATEVGGTHPALVEAMGYGNCILVNDTPENREVAGGTDCTSVPPSRPRWRSGWTGCAATPAGPGRAGEAAARRAARLFSWERVADHYAALLRKLAGQPL